MLGRKTAAIFLPNNFLPTTLSPDDQSYPASGAFNKIRGRRTPGSAIDECCSPATGNGTESSGQRVVGIIPGPVFNQMAAAWSELAGIDIVQQILGAQT